MTERLYEPGDVRLSDRPLIVCDVDDVVLEFLTPFTAYLQANRHELRPQSFRLNGNIFSLEEGTAVSHQAVAAFTDGFFAEQHDWQTAVETAAETLETLSATADVVFLTAMPPRYRETRRRLLDEAGMPYPIIATEEAKGPEVKALHGGRDLPVAFIDDIFINLHSVREHVPEALLINLMTDHVLKGFAPDPGDDVKIARDWADAERLIRSHFAAFAAPD